MSSKPCKWRVDIPLYLFKYVSIVNALHWFQLSFNHVRYWTLGILLSLYKGCFSSPSHVISMKIWSLESIAVMIHTLRVTGVYFENFSSWIAWAYFQFLHLQNFHRNKLTIDLICPLKMMGSLIWAIASSNLCRILKAVAFNTLISSAISASVIPFIE